MTGHARNSPSDAARWMNCAGALNLCKRLGIDKGESGRAASEGTAAHSVAEDCLRMGLDPYDFLGQEVVADGITFIVDQEMCDFLQPGLDRIREFEGEIFVERRVNCTEWLGKDEHGNDQCGTLDRGVIGEEEIVIGDLKYGRGIPVQCVGNKQIRIYALAFWWEIARHRTKATRFRFIIDQPRNAKGGGEWTQKLEELLAFGEEVKAKAAQTFDPNAPCTPSEGACLWCPAAKIEGACPDYEAWNLEFLGLTLDDLDADEIVLPDSEGLTVPRRATIYRHLSVIRKFLDRVEASVCSAVFAGEGAEYGLKAVAGRASKRVHKDEKLSEAWLKKKGKKDEEIFTKKLITVAQLDKLIGRGKFPAEYVVGGEKTPAIAPLDDARPELILAEPDYDNLDDFDDFE